MIIVVAIAIAIVVSSLHSTDYFLYEFRIDKANKLTILYVYKKGNKKIISTIKEFMRIPFFILRLY